MKSHFRSFCIKFLTIAGVSTTAWAYVVKNGDTLSTIAYKNISKKVYGNDGSFNKIISLNPQIKNPNFIKPGQVINLSETPAERYVATDLESSSENYVENKNSEVAANSTPLFERGATVALTPFYNIANLSATDNLTGSESIVASKYYVGVNASYVQEWNKDFQTAINLKLASIGFEEPASSIRTLQDKTKFLSSLGIETNHNVSESVHLKLGLSYGKELFIRAATTQSVAVDAVNIPTVSSKVSYDIKKLSPFTLGISATYAAKLPTTADSYKVKFGHEYGASIYLNQLIGKSQHSNIQTELGFTQRKQNTSLTTQKETNIVLGVRFFFDSGSGQ